MKTDQELASTELLAYYAMCKILERTVYVQKVDCLSKNHILYTFQSRFRKSFSTISCLIYRTNYISSQVAKGNYTEMVLLDLQKPFYTVDHEILCNKLRMDMV